DWGRHPGAGAHHRAVIPATLAEDLGVSRASGFGPGRTDGALLRVFVRAVAPQRALGAVPDLPAVTDVEQAGDLKLLVTERRADAAGPVVVRVLHDARIRVLQREAIGVDVQGAPGVALAYGAQAVGSPTRDVDDVRGPVGNAAPQEAAAEVDADRLAHHRYLVIEVAVTVNCSPAPSASTFLRLPAHCNPKSQPESGPCPGRGVRGTSQPRF